MGAAVPLFRRRSKVERGRARVRGKLGSIYPLHHAPPALVPLLTHPYCALPPGHRRLAPPSTTPTSPAALPLRMGQLSNCLRKDCENMHWRHTQERIHCENMRSAKRSPYGRGVLSAFYIRILVYFAPFGMARVSSTQPLSDFNKYMCKYMCTGLAQPTRQAIAGPLAALSLTPMHSLRHRL